MHHDPENQTELIQPELTVEETTQKHNAAPELQESGDIEIKNNDTAPPLPVETGPVFEEPSRGIPEIDVLQELLDDEDKFEEQIKIASPLELTVLLEKIESLKDIRNHIPKVPLLKRRFDLLTKPAEGEPVQDPQLVSRFNTMMSRFNRKRSILFEEIEKERVHNSVVKKELLEQLKAIVQKEEVQAINEVRNIQARWRETGWIMKDDIISYNTQYKHFLDIFYNLRGHHIELLDLDRKHNLEEKNKLIESIKNLVPENDTLSRETWRERSEQINEIQELWKTIGPVPKDQADTVNDTFNNTVDHFFNLRQAYYGSQDAERKVNAQKKQDVLAQLKVFSAFQGSNGKEWNEATAQVFELQKAWMETGTASKDLNKELWKEYRGLCDLFFENKSNFFKSFGEVRNQNLGLKIALCEKAESFKDSTEWKKSGEELKKIQEEWKKIGPVSEKDSQKIWKRFRKACDDFFERREKETQGAVDEQNANLEAKKGIIAEVEALIVKGLEPKEALEALGPLKLRWQEIGHVPYRDKEQIQTTWKKTLDAFFDQPKLKGDNMAELKLEANLGMISDTELKSRQIKDEMRKLQRQHEDIKKDFDDYSVNIQMISKGKSGDSLRAQIQKKIDDERAKLEKIDGKLKMLRKLLKELEAIPKPEAEVKPEA